MSHFLKSCFANHYLQSVGNNNIFSTNKRLNSGNKMCTSIFIAEFEEKQFFSFIKKISMLYFRFIKDIFMIQTKSENELNIFQKDLNKKHPLIKFNFKYSKDKIDFWARQFINTNIKNCKHLCTKNQQILKTI